MSCVQKHSKEMTIQDITMAMDTFTLLIAKHLLWLCQKVLLEIIVAKLKWLKCPLWDTKVGSIYCLLFFAMRIKLFQIHNPISYISTVNTKTLRLYL